MHATFAPRGPARARRAVTTSALCLSDVLDNGCVGPGHVHAAESLQNHRNPPATGTKMSARAPFSTDVHVYVSRGALDKAQAWAKARRLHHLLTLVALLKLVAARSASARSVAAVYGMGGACSRVVRDANVSFIVTRHENFTVSAANLDVHAMRKGSAVGSAENVIEVSAHNLDRFLVRQIDGARRNSPASSSSTRAGEARGWGRTGCEVSADRVRARRARPRTLCVRYSLMRYRRNRRRAALHHETARAREILLAVVGGCMVGVHAGGE